MSFSDLREFIDYLEKKGELHRVRTEVDPNQEIALIQHRVLRRGGPALLFENVKNSAYKLVCNLFGTQERVESIFPGSAGELGEELAGVAEKMQAPSLGKIWQQRSSLKRISKARLRQVNTGPVLANSQTPDLEKLPVLTCWPLDGGPFFTLPLVHTIDPLTAQGNLGIYRLQRYDKTTTGMHWQIEKGGGFHFHKAKELQQPLPVSVILGGPPALTIAAIAPLPEGMDERLLAALIMGKPLEVIEREHKHLVPARAEFILEGKVCQNRKRLEGPFGDHLGHYSHSAEFPVFEVNQILCRKDAIYPATVVGKPPQEDFFIGRSLQNLFLPLLKLTHPGISDLWAYPETGFHPLAVIAVKERYPREALKHVLGTLGLGQLSLTKVMIAVDKEVNPRDFSAVSDALWHNLDLDDGLHLLSPTAQDTLDFTGKEINTGSRLLLLATRRSSGPLRKISPPLPPDTHEVHQDIFALKNLGKAFLIVGVKKTGDKKAVIKSLQQHPITRQYLFPVLVSEDVNPDKIRSTLWGWFTRFDPLLDLHPQEREVSGNRLLLRPPIVIDATWKKGYRKPVAFAPKVEELVERRWSEYRLE